MIRRHPEHIKPHDAPDTEDDHAQQNRRAYKLFRKVRPIPPIAPGEKHHAQQEEHRTATSAP